MHINVFEFINISSQTNVMAILVVTGEPRIGKTAAVVRVAQNLKERGLKVGGIVSKEITSNNVRTGFEFIDLSTNQKATLASTSGKGPRIGKYFVDLEGCRFAVDVLIEAIRKSDVIICDELGPMEFKSQEFVDCVKSIVDLDKPVIVVVHRSLRHPVIDEFRNRASFSINIDLQNRNKAPDLLLDRLQ
ncbi:MAG TPA: NTPase [Nitrososphaerales archaeon]|nr:NTPase [Nitrososphaerales archaeon]